MTVHRPGPEAGHADLHTCPGPGLLYYLPKYAPVIPQFRSVDNDLV